MRMVSLWPKFITRGYESKVWLRRVTFWNRAMDPPRVLYLVGPTALGYNYPQFQVTSQLGDRVALYQIQCHNVFSMYMGRKQWSSIILFIAVGCGVIPIVLRLEHSSSLDSSIATTVTSPMWNQTSKDCPTFPTSLSKHISPVTAPVNGLWGHFKHRGGQVQMLQISQL